MNLADVIANQEEDLQLVVSAKRGKGRPEKVKLAKLMSGEELLKKFEDHIFCSSYKLNALREVKKVFNFLPDIKKDSLRELRILDSWTFFFTSKGVPFIVVEDGENRVLWKEKYVEE